jgi:hypothetical protein
MSIHLEQHRNPFTQTVIAIYKENAPVGSHFSSMFEPVPTESKYVSIEVERGTEKIAVDVNRLGGGNRNTFSKSTEKIFLPPMYDEFFDATGLDVYDKMVNSPRNAKLTGSTAVGVAKKLLELQKKVRRAEELQAAQVMETGIVVLKNGDNIDYKRKATSKVDAGGAGGYWTVTTTDIETQLKNIGNFFRTEGKSNVNTIDMTLSGAGYIALKKSDYFKTDANYNNVQLNDIRKPEKRPSGVVYNGQISAGSYIFNIWVYDETYEDNAGATQRYMAENQAAFSPVSGVEFNAAYGGLPTVINDPARVEFPKYISNVASRFMIYNEISQNRTSHLFGIRSAPLYVPVTVDRIYTLHN